jgi:hypothetical protein
MTSTDMTDKIHMKTDIEIDMKADMKTDMKVEVEIDTMTVAMNKEKEER